MTLLDTVECRYHGRDFTVAEMALMRSLIVASPQQTRAGLARALCRAIGWVGPDGRFRDMMARLTMLSMHRDGIITLPRRGSCAIRCPADPPREPMPRSLDAVRPIRFSHVTAAGGKASRLWNAFVARWHDLG